MSQEQQEQALQNSEPQAVDVTVNVGGDSRAERFLGTFDQISRLSLDIDRNYGNKRVLTDFPLEHDGAKWTGTINKLIVGFDYTITGHAYRNDNQSSNKFSVTVQNEQGSNKYFLNGQRLSEISLNKGETYEFDLNDVSTDSHPFFIGTSPGNGNYDGEYLNGITNSRATTGVLTFTVGDNTPQILY